MPSLVSKNTSRGVANSSKTTYNKCNNKKKPEQKRGERNDMYITKKEAHYAAAME